MPDITSPAELCKRLEEELRKLGSLTATAKRFSKGKSTIYYWLHHPAINLEQLAQLATLGADTQYIITGQRRHAPAPQPSAPALDQDQLQRLTTTVRYLKETLRVALDAVERAEGWLKESS